MSSAKARATASDRPPASVPDEPRRIGPYALLQLLGRGGMGSVYEARHVHLEKRVALKRLEIGHSHDAEEAVARFLREMRSIGSLKHPNIVEAYDAGEADGVYFLAMEFVDGADLKTLLAESDGLAVADAAEIVRQAAVGLHYIHTNNLLHRDVKPSNLLLDSDGVVKVADLGLARLREPTGQVELTSAGVIVGTADYVSPEQAQSVDLDERSDIYSLGCTFYHLLAGRPPFSGPSYGSAVRKFMAHIGEEPVSCRELRPEVPAELANLLERMMAKDPAQRIGLEEFIGEIEPFAARSELKHLGTALSDSRPSRGMETVTFERSTLPATAAAQKGRTSRFKTWSLGVGALALLALAFGIWGRTLTVPGNDDASSAGNDTGSSTGPHVPAVPSDPPSFEELSPAEIEPLKWYSLLKRKPETIVWNSAGGLSSIDFDADTQRASVTSRGIAMLSLGDVESRSYLLQVEISQPRWEGGVGLFFGLRDADCLQGSCRRVQSVVLDRHPHEAEKTGFRLVHESSTLSRGTDGSPFIEGTSTLHQFEDISRLELHPAMLELSVEDGKLAWVRWNAERMTLDLPRDAQRRLPECTGEFGLVVGNSHAVFRNARIMIDK